MSNILTGFMLGAGLAMAYDLGRYKTMVALVVLGLLYMVAILVEKGVI